MTFLLPDPAAFQSGGNHYNLRLLQALRESGFSFTTAHEPADIGAAGPIWVDTLMADSHLPEGRKHWLIVHHLTSLYPPPGYSSDTYFKAQEADLLSQFDGFLVSSPFTKAYLRQRGLSQPVIVVEPGMDPVPDVPVRCYTRIDAVMAANLVERKGILPFLALLQSRGPWPELSIRIYGEASLQPGYAEQCHSAIAKLPAGLAQYMGAIPQQAMAEIYRSANLFISTSFMETYGMALQEAAAFGLPLLVRDGGNAASHVREGETGCVCGSIGELVSWLERWQHERQELTEMGEYARTRAQRGPHSWQDAARQFWQQYQALQA